MPAVPDYFSKGLCGTYGADIPQQYAEDLRNLRIRNGVTIPRAGYRSVAPHAGAPVRAMASCLGHLYAVQAGRLWRVDVSAGAHVDLGAVGSSGPAHIEVFGNYLVILTNAQPFGYDCASETLFAITSYVVPSVSDFPMGQLSSNLQIAGTFQAASATPISTLGIQLKKVGTPADNVFLDLYATSGGIPTGSAIASSSTGVAGGTVTTSYADYSWTMSSPFTPVAGTVYAAVLRRTSGSDDSLNHYVAAGYASGGSPLARECLWNGSAWSSAAGAILAVKANGSVPFDPNSNPRFCKGFLNFNWAAGGNTGAFSKESILYVSAPVSATSPQKCYDWTGSGSDAIVMKAKIVGLASTLDRLFIFQENRIDWIGKSSYTTIGGVTTFSPSSLSKGDTLASKDAAVVAGDKVVFLTSNLRVKTIGYALGVDQPEIGSLSEPADNPEVGIQKWLDDNLHADQSGCFGWYDGKNRLVKFHVRTKSSPYNDIVLIWDLANQTFLVDSNKFFGANAKLGEDFFCGSSIDGEVYQDEYGEDDDGMDMTGWRRGCKLTLGVPGTYKVWLGEKINGTIRSGTVVGATAVCDGKAVDYCEISNESPTLSGAAVASWELGQVPLSGPLSLQNVKPYLKDRGPGYINAIGKRFGVDIDFTGSGMFFSLDGLATREKATKYVELSDMVPQSSLQPDAETFELSDESGAAIVTESSEDITVS